MNTILVIDVYNYLVFTYHLIITYEEMIQSVMNSENILLVSFHCYDKIHKEYILNGAKVYFSS